MVTLPYAELIITFAVDACTGAIGTLKVSVAGVVSRSVDTESQLGNVAGLIV